MTIMDARTSLDARTTLDDAHLYYYGINSPPILHAYKLVYVCCQVPLYFVKLCQSHPANVYFACNQNNTCHFQFSICRIYKIRIKNITMEIAN